MAIITHDRSKTIRYSLPSDKSEDKTIFILRPLSVRDKARLGSLAKVKLNDEGKPEFAEMTLETLFDMSTTALRFGLIGWENLKMQGDNGALIDVPFESEEVKYGSDTRALITNTCVEKYLSQEIVKELNDKIMEISNLTGEQIKN